MQELEKNKIEAEIAFLAAQAKKAHSEAEKADAEREALKRGWHEWSLESIKLVGAIALGAGGVTAAITGYQISEVKKERADLEVAKATTTIANLNAQQVRAREQLSKLETDAANLTKTLIARRSSNQNSDGGLDAAISSAADIGRSARVARRDLDTKAIDAHVSRTRGDYQVGLQTLGMSEDRRIELNNRLKQAGYGLHETSMAIENEDAPDWFAKTPTVFYYTNSAAASAKELAEQLRQITGKSFATQKGAGLGVDPAQRDTTLFVHLR